MITVDDVVLAAPLEEGDFRYFSDCVLPNLRPLTDDEYNNGLAVILHTFARYSYVLHQEDVYWCIEWEPGLIVVRFSPNGVLHWTALRSTIPGFGGRTPVAEDEETYDEDAENPQYNLVFNAWDAQFSADERAWKSFRPAEQEVVREYEAALSHVNQLGEQNQTSYSENEKFSEWSARCKANLSSWAGDGIRIK